MNASVVLGVLAILCALVSVGFGVQIAGELRARGIQANP